MNSIKKHALKFYTTNLILFTKQTVKMLLHVHLVIHLEYLVCVISSSTTEYTEVIQEPVSCVNRLINPIML